MSKPTSAGHLTGCARQTVRTTKTLTCRSEPSRHTTDWVDG
jgi:hypothetical protein